MSMSEARESTTNCETERRTRRFGLGKLSIGAMIISAFIGAEINDYYTRAKPEVVVTTIGFKAPLYGQSVALSEEVIALSFELSWSPSLREQESFGNALAVARACADGKREASSLVKELKDWNEANIGSSGRSFDSTAAIPEIAMWRHPLLKQGIGRNITTSLVFSGKLGPASHSLAEIEPLPKLFEIADQPQNERWVLYLHNQWLFFDYQNLSDGRKRDLALFVNSLGRGAKQNVAEYTARILSHTESAILKTSELQDSLETLLLPNAALSVEVSLLNAGGRPSIFQPYFAIHIDHDGYRHKSFVLAVELKGAGSNPSNGDVFLPKTRGQAYLTVPSGESINITLVGVDPLGEATSELLSLQESGLLSAEVAGVLFDGDPIWSEPTPFSLDVTDSQRQTLEQLVP